MLCIVSFFFETYFLCFVFFFIFFLSTFPFYSVSYSLFTSFVFDGFRFYIIFLTFFVLYISYYFILYISKKDLVCMTIFIPCFLVFSSSSGLLLYVSYEVSLLPIIYIILKWGSYPERSLRSLMLLVYTRIFSFPLILGLFYMYTAVSSFCLVLVYPFYTFSLLFSLVIFFSFCVKLPVYGLHYWLPMAHVEAPTFGSMILAGILLKLGGIGLVRFFFFLDLASYKLFFLSYFLFFLLFSSLICCFQSDFKRLVAYSSVAHMIAVPIVLISSSFMSLKFSVFLMLFHGLSSPVLFCLVGLTYLARSSRQLVLLRGLTLVSPLLSIIFIFSFLFTLSAPPYVSFFSEVFFFMLTVFITPHSIFFLLFFCLFCLVYNLNWLSNIIFRSVSSLNYHYSLQFSSVFPIFLRHFFSFILLFIVSVL